MAPSYPGACWMLPRRLLLRQIRAAENQRAAETEASTARYRTKRVGATEEVAGAGA
ncbi:MAG: hypothetical protein AAFN13_15855 [Bacteroidota bacterium]